jgi:predicted HD superfamily hydrolase involved in NAD metabolism
VATDQSPSTAEIRSRLERELPPDVLEHSRQTAAFARELAGLHGLDADKAELAGLLHDVGDRYSDKEILALAERYEIPISSTERRIPKLLHGAVGAEVLRREWGIADEQILAAVYDHVSGRDNMTPLTKVLFLADKLEPGRDRFYGGLDPIRELAKKDLNQAVLHLAGWRMTQLVNEGRPVHGNLVQTRNHIVEAELAEQGPTGWG